MPSRPGLADARKRAALSQEELGERVGVHEKTVSKWEQGKQGVHPDHRLPLARALQITLPELDRLIRGETLQPSRVVLIADGEPGTRWPLDIDRLPRRSFEWVPPAAFVPLINSSDDGLERARRHLSQIISAIRIPSSPAAGHKGTGVEIIITCGALGETLTGPPE